MGGAGGVGQQLGGDQSDIVAGLVVGMPGTETVVQDAQHEAPANPWRVEISPAVNLRGMAHSRLQGALIYHPPMC